MTDENDAKLSSIMATTNQTNEKYFSKQKAKLNNQDEKVKQHLKKIAQYRSNDNLWSKTEKEVKRRLKVFEDDRSVQRTWLHVDMDMFYAACEIRDRPDLIDHPVAIGDYSMIQTTNYVARKFGVRAAMPGFLGKQMCPNLVFIRANKEKYTRISDYEFMYLLKEFDERLESQGLDEANLDVTDYLQANGLDSPEGRMFLAQKIRQTISDKMKMTCSAGIGCNKMLAKICSEMDKPNGQTYLAFDREKILNFMAEKKVREIPGVGGVLEQQLAGIGVFTCSDIIEKATELYLCFNDNQFEFLQKAAVGIARHQHTDGAGSIAKRSISLSKSFNTISRKEQYIHKLEVMCAQLAQRCTMQKLMGRQLMVEFRSQDFDGK